MPKSILTTSRGVQSGGVEPEFNSLSYHGRVRKTNETGHWTDQEEWNVKIFSEKRISDEWLSAVFDHVGWVYRKEVSVCALFVYFLRSIVVPVGCVSSVALHCQVSPCQD